MDLAPKTFEGRTNDSNNSDSEVTAIRVFNGHSGAALTLLRAPEGSLFVRKQAVAAEQNERLQEQCQIQEKAHQSGLMTPEVYRSGFKNDRFFFDMEYIVGRSLAQVLIEDGVLDRDSIIRFLVSIVSRFCCDIEGVVNVNVFYTKLKNIEAAIDDHGGLIKNSVTLQRSLSILRESDWNQIPLTTSHGDLTLENVLLTDAGEFTLIDFDATGMSSYFFDIAKIFQDAAGLWCLRQLMAKKSVHAVSIQIELGRLRRQLLNAVRRAFPEVIPKLNQLVILNLLRTLPYIQDTHTMDWVVWRLERLNQGEFESQV